MNQTPGFLQEFAHVIWMIIAAFGGVARYFSEYINTGVAPKLGLLVAHCFVSGFSGYMVAQVILQVYPDWALVAAGIGGYLGTHGLEWIGKAVRNKFKVVVNIQEKNDDDNR